MRTIKGPAIFLAQFAGDAAPFNSFDAICGWAARLGYKGVQIPTWVGSLIDLEKAATSKTYADELTGTAAKHGLAITELSTHLQGQLVNNNCAFRNGQGCRRPKRTPKPRTPDTGTEANKTPAAAVCVSKYFCTTYPPMEWPTRIGGLVSVWATWVTSAT